MATASRSRCLFLEDAYLTRCAATVIGHAPDGGVVLDQTVFYANSGGQPGDIGTLGELAVIDCRKAEGETTPVHVLAEGSELPAVGSALDAAIDAERRLRVMRMHTALHLVCAALQAPITGAQVGDGKGRIDLSLPDQGINKAELQARLDAWIKDDQPVRAWWIDDVEFDARPELVKSMSVSPPRGSGRVRLVEIDGVDLQACGGTHVASTGAIGGLQIAKIENKGRQNRRVNLVLV